MSEQCAACGASVTWSMAAQAWINPRGTDPLRCPDTGKGHTP